MQNPLSSISELENQRALLNICVPELPFFDVCTCLEAPEDQFIVLWSGGAILL